MKRLFFASAVLIAATLAGAFTLLDNNATVVDGDTLIVQGERVRLWGMDAPELGQTCTSQFGKPYRCGFRAAEVLTNLIAGKKVDCWVESEDRYQRHVATCTVGGQDIGEAMVRAGWAIDSPYFSKGNYAKAEAEARAARRGMWQGTFEKPWEWRRARR